MDEKSDESNEGRSHWGRSTERCLGDRMGCSGGSMHQAGSDHQKMHPQNLYLSTCNGRLYLPIANDQRPYLRVDDVNLSDVEPLPFRYLKVPGRIYYVAMVFEFFDETKMLLPIEGIDSATAEALDERHIRDKDNKFTVLDGQVLFEPRVDR